MVVALQVRGELVHVDDREPLGRIDRNVGPQRPGLPELAGRAVRVAHRRAHHVSHTETVTIACKIGVPEVAKLNVVELVLPHEIDRLSSDDPLAAMPAPVGKHLREGQIVLEGSLET